MRRILLVFAVTLLLVELGVRLVATQFPPEIRASDWYRSDTAWNVTALGQHLRNFASAAEEPEILVAGSSSVGAAVDADMLADELGASAYTFWVPGADVAMIEDLVFRVALNEVDAHTIVVGLTAREFNTGPSQREARAALHSSPGFERFTSDGAVETIEDTAQRVSALVRYRDVLRRPTDLASALRGETQWDNGEVGPRGTNRRQRTSDALLHEGYVEQESAATEGYDPSTVPAQLRPLLRALQAEADRVVLVEPPLADEYVPLFPRGARDVEATRAAMRRVADQLGIVFVEAPACHEFESSDFADPNHLAPSGRAAMTRCVSDALRQHAR